jgi:rhodanese-related sulfurtransferase
MFKPILKFAVRVATKPARLAFSLIKSRLFGDEADVGPSGTRPAPPPPPRPPSQPAGPSPFDVQVDPGAILRRIDAGESFTFVDVRQSAELAATGVIEGAVHIPTQDLPRRADELPKDGEIVLYCAAGVRSLDAAMFLREKGYETTWSLGGGLPHWEADGGKVVPVA